MFRNSLVIVALTLSLSCAPPGRDLAPERVSAGGRELVMVFFTRRGCGACENPELRETIRQARVQLQERSEALGMQFVGIAADIGPPRTDCFRYFRPFGKFDEFSFGGGWLSSVGTLYVTRDTPGIGATPQLVVIERDVTTRPRLAVSDHELVIRIVGDRQIASWVQQGSPLPIG